MKIKDMNGNQKIAYFNTKRAAMYEIAGWANAIADGYPEDVPETEEDAKQYIYDCAVNDCYLPGSVASGRAPKEMRFAGAEFIKTRIDHIFAKDEDIAEIAKEKGWR